MRFGPLVPYLTLKAPSFTDPEAMSAPDQLRQRMAWALSQVVVVGTGGFTHEWQNELWLNYYDILVRKAGSQMKSDTKLIALELVFFYITDILIILHVGNHPSITVLNMPSAFNWLDLFGDLFLHA